jgi:hypothetical protein
MITMTSEHAYAAMFYFLEDLHGRIHSDDIGGLLGGMSLLADGRPADQGVVADWHRAMQRAMTEGSAGLALRLGKD